MSSPDTELLQPLIKLYIQLGGGVLLGWILGRALPKTVPTVIGRFLFWIGVPVSIIAFLRHADLSGAIWIAPVAAWMAILLGAGLAWVWIQGCWRILPENLLALAQRYISLSKAEHELLPACSDAETCSHSRSDRAQARRSLVQDRLWAGKSLKKYNSNSWSKPVQGSFLLASMVGNTGYLGYPVILALVGEKYFGWALFYDMLGTTIGAYGLGVLLAARFGGVAQSHWQLVRAILQNPALWSLGLGLGFRQIPLPELAERSLQGFAWSAIALSLVLIGMRLSQLKSGGYLRQASMSLAIKMLLVPLILGIGLFLLGITGSPLLVIVLQMAMPPAFATLVLAEVYNLDRDLSVTTLAIGSIGLLLTLPIWLFLFSP